MQTPFSNSGYISTNGRQSSIHREHPIYDSVGGRSIFNPSTSHQRMETKILLTVLSYVGYGSVLGGILLNLANWKSDILFGSGLVFLFLKFIRIMIRIYQEYKREEIEQKIL